MPAADSRVTLRQALGRANRRVDGRHFCLFDTLRPVFAQPSGRVGAAGGATRKPWWVFAGSRRGVPIVTRTQLQRPFQHPSHIPFVVNDQNCVRDKPRPMGVVACQRRLATRLGHAPRNPTYPHQAHRRILAAGRSVTLAATQKSRVNVSCDDARDNRSTG